MNYKKILMSVSVIVFATALALGGTRAFFSDSETSTGNTFTAGDIDLQIDNESYAIDYNIPGYENPVGAFVASEHTSWELVDLTVEKFFDFIDLKPGDYGEDTISIHVGSNDAWVCAAAQITEDLDNSITEPEDEVAGANNDGDDGTPDGDLDSELQFAFWVDDGDNVLEDDEVGGIFLEGTLEDMGQAGQITLADSGGSILGGNAPIPGGETFYIAKAWCFGELSANPVAQGDNSPLDDTGILCDGSQAGNIAQTDSVEGDLQFYAEQARHNDQFLCSEWQPSFPNGGGERDLVGAALGDYTAPQECNVTVGETGNEGESLQDAIDRALDGETVCVPEGTYNEFSVDKPLTVAGLVNPTTSATVVPSSTSVTALALVTSSDVTITGLHFDGSGVLLDGNQAAGVQISPAGSDIDNVNIVYNLIENLNVDGSNTTASNKGIQWFTDTGSGLSLTNSAFEHNVIDNISSAAKGGYGIQTVGDMDNVSIAYNTISDTTGAWGAGVALDSKDLVTTTGVSVDHNHIMSDVHDGVSRFAVQVEANVDGGGIVVNTNNIESLLYGGSSGTASPDTLDAEDNWWGTPAPADGTDIFVFPVTNVVDFDPAEAAVYPSN